IEVAGAACTGRDTLTGGDATGFRAESLHKRRPTHLHPRPFVPLEALFPSRLLFPRRPRSLRRLWVGGTGAPPPARALARLRSLEFCRIPRRPRSRSSRALPCPRRLFPVPG